MVIRFVGAKAESYHIRPVGFNSMSNGVFFTSEVVTAE